ncbi:RimJ/RimL family protein N-acetyltransferase [Ilumatobacter fluminis]|uniref:RimJ/RimL family protein N-acetyltransferase n=1 Tax=Ilumatobacter fluminis TaxID=467091 RepID=A0A4R7HZX8_9ACTN|nr:GNAT family N-acetyltransferase [Ilumatobacter fluminis]TDT16685.1 RimJ/RimL family protein N-acetyltransferase [Ilumatobacter fluminis]
MKPMAAFRLETERLVIRPLASRDVPEFVRYRNIDDVARYQDWPLPYTADLADELVAEVERLGRPTPGQWIQLAIDHEHHVVGDYAIWLDGEGQLAAIGYTVAPEQQGHNYAVEATRAVVEWLFLEAGVHRVTATIDPENVASARVLERCGFEHNGTVRSSALVRGQWADDTRFSLLRPAWEKWRNRDIGAPDTIELIEVTHDNIHDVCRIEVSQSQRRYVSSVAQSIADAAHPPVRDGVVSRPWYRAIVADDQLAGFVMLALPDDAHPAPCLWRLLVDTWYQRRGIARRTIALIADMLTEHGCDRLDVSFVDEPGGPERFYAQLGFERTGVIDDDGEVWASANLDEIVRRVRGA